MATMCRTRLIDRRRRRGDTGGRDAGADDPADSGGCRHRDQGSRQSRSPVRRPVRRDHVRADAVRDRAERDPAPLSTRDNDRTRRTSQGEHPSAMSWGPAGRTSPKCSARRTSSSTPSPPTAPSTGTAKTTRRRGTRRMDGPSASEAAGDALTHPGEDRRHVNGGNGTFYTVDTYNNPCLPSCTSRSRFHSRPTWTSGTATGRSATPRASSRNGRTTRPCSAVAPACSTASIVRETCTGTDTCPGL